LPLGVIGSICGANRANHANIEQREIKWHDSTAGNTMQRQVAAVRVGQKKLKETKN